MLQFSLSIIGILITILFVIGTHEFAHFFAARCLGVKVLRFSIGFGKKLIAWHDKKGTEYVFAIIPLGGYVKMLDEHEDQVKHADLPYAYNRQPFYKKFIIVLAGPAMNILCAFLLYWVIFMIGFVALKPVIGSVAPRSIAAESGLTANQEITKIDNKITATWTNVVFQLLSHAGNQDHLKMEVRSLSTSHEASHILDLSNWHMQGLTPDPLGTLGITPYTPPIPLIIGEIAKDSPAQSSPLKLGDTIMKINHKTVTNWEDVIKTIVAHPNETMEVTIKRDNQIKNISVAIGSERSLLFHKMGYLGIGPKFEWPKALLHTIKYSPLNAISPAWDEITHFTYFNILLFQKIITGKLSLETLGGPITIFESAGAALNYGMVSFLSFLAFLSISIGIINLFPIPGLDGGHLLIQFIEAIIRRPIPEQYLINLYRIGFLLLFFILTQALVNDIMRLY